jgi:hypothetical protein
LPIDSNHSRADCKHVSSDNKRLPPRPDVRHSTPSARRRTSPLGDRVTRVEHPLCWNVQPCADFRREHGDEATRVLTSFHAVVTPRNAT